MTYHFVRVGKKGTKMKNLHTKNFALFSILCINSLSADIAEPLLPYQVSIEPLWYELDQQPEARELFGGKWLVVGKITFKYKDKEFIKLDNLLLDWTGGSIDYLLGTLYMTDVDETFLPIESYVICDSNWNKSQQMMRFNFNKPYTIDPHTTFFVVLTVPDEVEPILKTGSFMLRSVCLPPMFRTYAHNNPLALTWGTQSVYHAQCPVKNSPHVHA